MKTQSQKHALVQWRKKWQSDEWYFTSHCDGVEREPIKGGISIVLNLPNEITGYVEESKINWARGQLLLERQKYLISGYAQITKGLEDITKLMEAENEKQNTQER